MLELPNGSTSESQEVPQRAGSNSPRIENSGEGLFMEVLSRQNPTAWRSWAVKTRQHGGLGPSEPNNSSTKFQTANRGKLDNMRRPIAFLICLLLVAIQISLTSTSLQENNYLFRRGAPKKGADAGKVQKVETVYDVPKQGG
ncbi:hypothetical protein M8J77_012533 [Diaphorina citri]|nr:hypothetical protein M8J77_012533 [Diaphorina citri]